VPMPGAVAACMEGAYSCLKNDDWIRNKMRDEAYAGARPFQVDTVIERYWLPVLDALRAQIEREHRRGVLRIVRSEEVGIERAA
jgi:uncharacterized protein YqcC (DUF446 family)